MEWSKGFHRVAMSLVLHSDSTVAAAPASLTWASQFNLIQHQNVFFQFPDHLLERQSRVKHMWSLD